MSNANELFVVYIEQKGYDGYTRVLGYVNDLESFKEFAAKIYGISTEPLLHEYGRNSMHYEYSVEKTEKYSEYYHLVAEPACLLTTD